MRCSAASWRSREAAREAAAAASAALWRASSSWAILAWRSGRRGRCVGRRVRMSRGDARGGCRRSLQCPARPSAAQPAHRLSLSACTCRRSAATWSSSRASLMLAWSLRPSTRSCGREWGAGGRTRQGWCLCPPRGRRRPTAPRLQGCESAAAGQGRPPPPSPHLEQRLEVGLLEAQPLLALVVEGLPVGELAFLERQPLGRGGGRGVGLLERRLCLGARHVGVRKLLLEAAAGGGWGGAAGVGDRRRARLWTGARPVGARCYAGSGGARTGCGAPHTSKSGSWPGRARAAAASAPPTSRPRAAAAPRAVEGERRAGAPEVRAAVRAQARPVQASLPAQPCCAHGGRPQAPGRGPPPRAPTCSRAVSASRRALASASSMARADSDAAVARIVASRTCSVSRHWSSLALPRSSCAAWWRRAQGAVGARSAWAAGPMPRPPHGPRPCQPARAP
jgi:hypothetical protein